MRKEHLLRGLWWCAIIGFMALCIYPYEWPTIRIQSRQWKYAEGFYLEDMLHRHVVTFRNDSIYQNGRAVAVILECNQPIHYDGAHMRIRHLRSGEIGRYIELGPAPLILGCGTR